MKPTIICLTPVKNEEWIIEKFLKAASIWADKIIISDQGSTDRTVEISRKFPKVTIIDNSNLKDFDEQRMRNPLFLEARNIPGKRLLISLDADELFTPNFDSPEWNTMFNAEEGTRFIFSLFNIRPNFREIVTDMGKWSCAFIDDGSEYDMGLIHVPRQPLRDDVPAIEMHDISILHFNYTNWIRLERKNIWYQMFEHINFPNKSVIDLYRNYHPQIDKLTTHIGKVFPFNKEWVDKYAQHGIDITSVNHLPSYPWDRTIIEYINKYSIDYFKRLDMGDIDWRKKAAEYDDIDLSKFDLHRNFIDKILLNYLKRTQRMDFRKKLYLRAIDKVLKKLF